MRVRFKDLVGQIVAALLVLLGGPVCAATMDIRVLDVDGNPVSNIAVYVTQGNATDAGIRQSAIMDQRDTRFVPHILVVQKGTTVEFPNSDVVAHHVYSFSKPNDFVLPLYRGNAHKPVMFEHDGIVTLGCNIHDQMLGYIVVVNTDIFGITDENGMLSVEIDEAASDATVSVWSPRIRDKDLTQVVAATAKSATFSLQKKLRPAHDSNSGTMQWSEY
jgi:plastocyanin